MLLPYLWKKTSMQNTMPWLSLKAENYKEKSLQIYTDNRFRNSRGKTYGPTHTCYRACHRGENKKERVMLLKPRPGIKQTYFAQSKYRKGRRESIKMRKTSFCVILILMQRGSQHKFYFLLTFKISAT